MVGANTEKDGSFMKCNNIKLRTIIVILMLMFVEIISDAVMKVEGTELERTELERVKDEFYESINYDTEKGLLNFRIPKTIPKNYKFYLHVSGRMFMGDKSNGMSFHAFDEESQNNSWVKGKTYYYQVKSNNLDEILLDFGLKNNDKQIIYSIHISPSGTKSIVTNDQYDTKKKH
jgi:hypothetical protein